MSGPESTPLYPIPVKRPPLTLDGLAMKGRCDETAAKEYRRNQGVQRKDEEKSTEENKIVFWHVMLRR